MSDRLTILAPSSPSAPSSVSSRRAILLLIALAGGATLLLYVRSLAIPVLYYDDFQILTQSWTWPRTRDGLWVPQNEHAMPLGRLLCFALEALAGRLPVLPFVICLVGPLALLLALGLVYVFVRRELGHSFYALLAVVLFGVTSVYHQAVWWFAASFAVIALDTLLLGLLAAQRWRKAGRLFDLGLVTLACLLAPGWFAIGVLAGPLCSLYLLAPAPGERLLAWRRLLAALAPVAGTALFLAVSLPRTAATIMHLEHYQGRTAVEAFDPLIGLWYSTRSVVDNLLLGIVGITGVALPVWCALAVLGGAVLVGGWWWRQVPDRRLMVLGLGLIGSSYVLVYSARSTWDYDQMTQPNFARYHLLPHLGLVLFFCGGLPGRAGRWFTLAADGAPVPRQRRMIGVLIGVCLLLQLPRGLLCGAATGWHPLDEQRAQRDALRRIEEVDARCRAHHISAPAARQALGRLDIPLSQNVIDGWEFLCGSDDSRSLPPEEVKRLLDAP
jgi:hypothetical protein